MLNPKVIEKIDFYEAFLAKSKATAAITQLLKDSSSIQEIHFFTPAEFGEKEFKQLAEAVSQNTSILNSP